MRPVKRILCAITVSFLLLAAGCDVRDLESTSSGQDISSAVSEEVKPRPVVDGERLYRIPLGNDWLSNDYWVVDADGNEVIPAEEAAPDYTEVDLDDPVTGETRYRFRMREETVRDEQGYPVTRRMRSLYDLNGNQLLDWEYKNYIAAFGEYIIRQDARDGIVSADEIPKDYHTALYHVPTGTEMYEGAFSVGMLDDDAFLLCDNWGTPLGVANSSGEAVSGFPTPKKYYNAYIWNGYITASSTHPYERSKDGADAEYLLDKNFRELYTFDSINGIYYNLRGEYLIYRDGNEQGILLPDEGVIFSVGGASIDYFDGELAIIRAGSRYTLITRDDTAVASGFTWLTPAQIYDDKEPAEIFLGVTDEKAVIIDRAGNVLVSSDELPGITSVDMLCDGLYTFQWDISYGTGLLGPNLEVLVPMGRYTWISLAPGIYHGNGEWDGNSENALLQAGKDIFFKGSSRSIYRTDILDHTGKVVIDNVTSVYDTGPGRIALRRGFDVGLIDWGGNWIVRRSVFGNLGDD